MSLASAIFIPKKVVIRMELKETIELMQSDDYKDRFKAEYYQVKTRLEKLEAMLDKWDKGELDFTPTCPRMIYDGQVQAMSDYCSALIARAAMEHIVIE
ncbi:hypothetical protein SAMN02910325_00598 [Ruminococcus flavefaciens]|uniref:Uncharacterized protein n=2 Tax=Ruminococcus flavefaciens TaxID=1265 RepID=A0A315Y321_RUMFL|nr:hypothetical protein IE37_00598 [Ruminococcus flavefaciens]SSA42643.1 hypothetical protein SAMN02910325_00598 [Ruminococcus flavefaciens]